jgi:hypothetical protein
MPIAIGPNAFFTILADLPIDSNRFAALYALLAAALLALDLLR